MTLQEFYQKRFYLRKHGGLTHADLYDLAPFEFDIEWRLVLSELKQKE
jgi:hypothetical protein